MLNFNKLVNFSLCLGAFVIQFHCLLAEPERKLSQELNPGCNATCGKLIVIKAVGPNDTLLYLWDFGHKPTFLMAEVPLKTELKINWTKFSSYEENSIQFSMVPAYMFGIVINKIYEFNDKNDTGILSPENKQIISLGTENFNWTILGLLDDISNNRILYSVGANGYKDGNVSKSGFVNLTAYAYGNNGHGEGLPHLLHTENSSQIDLVMDNFRTFFEHSRFAVELIAFSSNEKYSKVKLSAQKTLDDENAPGVFTLDTLLVEDPSTKNKARSGFLQWRPIVYTSVNKVVTNSTKTLEYEVANVSDVFGALNSSLLYAFQGTYLSNFLIKAENVSFGSNKDGFYSKTNYMSWSFLLGVGSPPQQPFSMIVFLIIAIGLGLPTLIVIGGTAFMIIRKIRSGE